MYRQDAPGYQLVLSGDATHSFGALLPAGLVAALAIGDVDPDPLFPGEGALVGNAVEKRRLEFARGRSCARRALSALGFTPAPLLADARRAPVWPYGVVGSLSHCHGFCCAVVGHADRWAAIGVDVELLRTPIADISERIASESERRALAALNAEIPWTCVLFSIKESIYKAWYPLARSWLEFHDVAVRLAPESGTFQADIAKAPSAPFRSATGSFCLDGDRVISLVAIARLDNGACQEVASAGNLNRARL